MAEHVGATIKQLREAVGMSKSRLGREAGVSNAYIVQIEQGDRSPSEDVLRRIAHVLRVPPHKLLIPAGLVDAEDVAHAQDWLNKREAEAAAAGRTLNDDSRDRVFAIGLGWADPWGAFDPRDRDHEEPGDPDKLTREQFWGWDKPLTVLPLEHWEELSDSDRRLVQRMVNRLARNEEPED